MRKIKENEIFKVAEMFATIFDDYEMYDAVFPHDKKWHKRMTYSYVYEVYAGADYTYVDDDFTCVATIKKPGDKERNMIGLWLKPFFLIKFFAIFGIKASIKASNYIKTSAHYADTYFNESEDCYIKNIGVVKSERGKGKLTMMINELCGDYPIYLETHKDDNVEIYKKLGFEMLEVGKFKQYNHYCMKRKAK